MWESLRRRLQESLQQKIDSFQASDRAAAQGRLQSILAQSNPWIAFQMLQKEIGQATYRDIIREAMRPADTARAPETYRSIWKLRVRGLISLNIDRLATQAFIDVSNRSNPLEFTGHQGIRLGYLLKDPKPFILNLHGHADDAASWVFTKQELDDLRNAPGYVDFIRSCFFSTTVVFIGISAEDLSVGGHLEQLAGLGLDSGTHFWVTARTDVDTDRWAESVGVRVIRYAASGNDHSALDEMFRDLLNFVPPEDVPLQIPVVAGAAHAGDDTSVLPSADELAKREANELRYLLNDYVRGIADKGDSGAQEYAAFRSAYDEAIYRAWYIRPETGHNRLLGYKVDKQVAKGAFGSVYSATDQAGDAVAIKLLLEEIRNNVDLLQSFRRGVRSMRILAQNRLDGVVAYRDSSEIPAFVVMEWIDGPSLEEAVEARQLSSWTDILRTSTHLTRIIRQAHELPERVLHRDLRPSNVMLKGFYAEPDHWKVMVLDFDLSWHRGATERSVVHGSTLFGYLAPEQIVRISGVSTRHSAVDSFGLGMILFFMISGRHPLPAEHRHTEWANTVGYACKQRDSARWRSIPARCTRLILAATQDQQARRWDVTQIENELSRLFEAAAHPDQVRIPDLVAEEVAARTEVLQAYKWDDNESTAATKLPTGLDVKLRADTAGRRLHLEIDWGNTGIHGHKKVGKWLNPAARECSSILRSVGWDPKHETDMQALRIRASIDSDEAAEDLPRCVTSIDRALDPLRKI